MPHAVAEHLGRPPHGVKVDPARETVNNAEDVVRRRGFVQNVLPGGVQHGGRHKQLKVWHEVLRLHDLRAATHTCQVRLRR